MATQLGPAFAPTWAGRPPHMSALDFVLWQRYRRAFPSSAVRLFFDVAVGAGVDAGGAVDASVRDAWTRLTQQRIDVVEEHAGFWRLLEFRNAAGAGALGSLIAYGSLWAADPPDRRAVKLVLVTDVFSDNLKPALAGAGIELILV